MIVSATHIHHLAANGLQPSKIQLLARWIYIIRFTGTSSPFQRKLGLWIADTIILSRLQFLSLRWCAESQTQQAIKPDPPSNGTYSKKQNRLSCAFRSIITSLYACHLFLAQNVPNITFKNKQNTTPMNPLWFSRTIQVSLNSL